MKTYRTYRKIDNTINIVRIKAFGYYIQDGCLCFVNENRINLQSFNKNNWLHVELEFE